MTSNRLRIAILGASGYTGAELVRLLARHPNADIVLMTADRRAGADYDEVFPHLGALNLPRLVDLKEVDWGALDADVVFCALPHGTTQETVAQILDGRADGVKVIDISADFRLEDEAAYEKWYGHEHLAPQLQKEAVYGLTELARDLVREARLVANPGCYPTSAILPLAPLLFAGQIEDDIIIDAKSGVSGAGRAAKEGSLFGEVAEGVHAYGVASHRHTPEIEQALAKAAGREIAVNFTPHLMPMSRGILSSIYVRLKDGATADDLRETLAEQYRGEPFVRVVKKGVSPATRHVRGSNFALIGVFADRVPGRAILLCAIDNLVKGASGQAVQNMNVMFGIDEATALDQQPLFP
jgi:N-acetyl-gamma-glutamyl-phosphate reductase